MYQSDTGKASASHRSRLRRLAITETNSWVTGAVAGGIPGDASQTWLGVVELLRRGQHVVSGLGRLQPRLREQILAVGEDFRMRLDGNPVLLTAELRAGPGRFGARYPRRCRVRFLDQRIEVDEDLSRFYTTALPYRAGPNLMISDPTGPHAPASAY